ncbi:hypothetical protein [Rheinheimera texasensis]|uniref:hypothetical protein n=1 Tax=Rheinheimera texasensis TaxID=306205 RepID=UPI0032B16FB6
MDATALLQLMYDSALGTALAESLYMYPLVEGSHLLSLAFSFGLIVLIDLRLTGIALVQLPVHALLRQLRPYLLAGFVITFITGILLTFAAGPELLNSFVFPLKLLLIVLAGLNAIWFEWRYGRDVTQWQQAPHPAGVRLAGFASLGFWSGVVILGRLIPYLDSGF